MAPQRPPGPGKLTTDPDLNRAAPTKLLAIDWASVSLSSDADAIALWQQIAPTGTDWETKLEEIPDEGPIASRLALALLRQGNFTCAKPAPAGACATPRFDVDPPAPGANLDDPCLRRMIAMWAIESLDDADLPAALDALRAIAAIPPPESQLVAQTLDAFPETDQAQRLELRGIAFAAGHRELVNGTLNGLDIPRLVDALQKYKIDGVLDVLSAESHRAMFLAAVTDEAIAPAARTQAMVELAALTDEIGGKLPRDVHTAIVTATRAKDCGVSAAARRMLVARGEAKFGPVRPRARTSAAMMRSLCVLASYEQQQRADEASYLLGYVPARGLEVVTVTYDPYNDVDNDGDGSPMTERTTTLVPRNEVTLPELDDLVRAFASCKGTTCTSADREFKFGFKPGPGGDLLLARLDVIEKPPCAPTGPPTK